MKNFLNIVHLTLLSHFFAPASTAWRTTDSQAAEERQMWVQKLTGCCHRSCKPTTLAIQILILCFNYFYGKGSSKAVSSKAVKWDFFSVASTLIAESRAKNAGYSLKSL